MEAVEYLHPLFYEKFYIRILLACFFGYFTFHIISALSFILMHKHKKASDYLLVMLSSMVYILTIYVKTYDDTYAKFYSTISVISVASAISTLFFYIRTVEVILTKKYRLLKHIKWQLTILAILFSTLSWFHIFYKPIENTLTIKTAAITEIMEPTIVGNLYLLYLLLIMVFTNFYLLSKIYKHHPEEKLLKLGIIITLIAIVHDCLSPLYQTMELYLFQSYSLASPLKQQDSSYISIKRLLRSKRT